MKTKIMLLMITGVLVASCSVAHLYTSESVIRYTPTDYEKIEIYVSETVEGEYTIVGEVIASAEDFNGSETSIKALKKEAAKLGANAVINLKMEIGHGYFGNSVISKGVAIRYNN